jgi:hypothetical protein
MPIVLDHLPQPPRAHRWRVDAGRTGKDAVIVVGEALHLSHRLAPATRTPDEDRLARGGAEIGGCQCLALDRQQMVGAFCVIGGAIGPTEQPCLV